MGELDTDAEVDVDRLVEQANQPALFGRHNPYKASLVLPKTQVKAAFD